MPSGLLLCDDLIFASRITGEARALGLTVKPARSLEQLFDFVRQEPPSCVLVDLAFPELVLPDLFRRLGEACNPTPRVVAYGSHVDADSLRRPFGRLRSRVAAQQVRRGVAAHAATMARSHASARKRLISAAALELTRRGHLLQSMTHP